MVVKKKSEGEGGIKNVKESTLFELSFMDILELPEQLKTADYAQTMYLSIASESWKSYR